MCYVISILCFRKGWIRFCNRMPVLSAFFWCKSRAFFSGILFLNTYCVILLLICISCEEGTLDNWARATIIKTSSWKEGWMPAEKRWNTGLKIKMFCPEWSSRFGWFIFRFWAEELYIQSLLLPLHYETGEMPCIRALTERWFVSQVVRHRSAKPSTAVRFRHEPH